MTRSQHREVRKQRISVLAGITAALKWAERRRDNETDATAITTARNMEAADNEALHAYIPVHTRRRTAIHHQRKLGQRSRSKAKVEIQIRSRNRNAPDWREVESLETNQNNKGQGLASSVGKWEDEIGKHEGNRRLFCFLRCLSAARATPWYAKDRTEKHELPSEGETCTLFQIQQVQKEDTAVSSRESRDEIHVKHVIHVIQLNHVTRESRDVIHVNT